MYRYFILVTKFFSLFLFFYFIYKKKVGYHDAYPWFLHSFLPRCSWRRMSWKTPCCWCSPTSRTFPTPCRSEKSQRSSASISTATRLWVSSPNRAASSQVASPNAMPLLPQWYVQSTCATQGTGMYEGLDWLSKELSKWGAQWAGPADETERHLAAAAGKGRRGEASEDVWLLRHHKDEAGGQFLHLGKVLSLQLVLFFGFLVFIVYFKHFISRLVPSF